MRPLLVVTGTRAEGSLAAGPGVTVLAGGGDGRRLARDLARLAPGACGIVSFGTGAGLVPGLRAGDMVIGSALAGAPGVVCDPAWVRSLTGPLPRARIGTVFASDDLLVTAAAKARAAGGGALLADMESHLAGAAAVRHGLPFAMLRCVSDAFDAALPPAVAVAMRPGGGLAPAAIIGSILRRPGQLPALIRTGRQFGEAFARLREATRAVGPRLGFDRRAYPTIPA